MSKKFKQLKNKKDGAGYGTPTALLTCIGNYVKDWDGNCSLVTELTISSPMLY